MVSAFDSAARYAQRGLAFLGGTVFVAVHAEGEGALRD